MDLATALVQDIPDWRLSLVLLMDNCSAQKTQMTLAVLLNLGYRVIFSAPGSFTSAPVEKVFGALKSKDIRSRDDLRQ